MTDRLLLSDQCRPRSPDLVQVLLLERAPRGFYGESSLRLEQAGPLANSVMRLQADFMFLFDNRFLLDFTPQELVRLLRALFADSPQRDAAVKRILQGHPEAPADAEEEA